MAKGDRGERWLCDKVEDELGYYAQRTGASGGGTDRHRPDVIMSAPGVPVYFVELKNKKKLNVRFKRREVEELEEAAARFGATAIYMAKPDLRKHDHVHAFTKDELKENEKSFSITQDVRPGRSVADLFSGC